MVAWINKRRRKNANNPIQGNTSANQNDQAAPVLIVITDSFFLKTTFIFTSFEFKLIQQKSKSMMLMHPELS